MTGVLARTDSGGEGPPARVALVTGAAGGLGSRICTQLAAAGYAVVVAGRVSDERSREVAGKCRAAGPPAWDWPLDLLDPAATQGRLADFGSTFGRLDVLVHAAGCYADSTVAQLRDEDLDRVFQVNTYGAFRLARFAAAMMQPGGAVVLISSLDSVRCAAGSAAYAASKAALEALGRTLARELGPRNITVNALLPGAVDSPLLRTLFTERQRDRLAARTPLGRLGTADDVAEAVAWLTSHGSRWVTGQAIRVDGGLGP